MTVGISHPRPLLTPVHTPCSSHVPHVSNHCLYIDLGKNIVMIALPICAAFFNDVDAKKTIAILVSANWLWAIFIAHGVASPDKMHEPYLTRITSKPPFLVMAFLSIGAFGYGIAVAP
jgi:hypothetical protein